jgi:hypothetical protein
MRRLLLATTVLTALTAVIPAKADVVVTNNLSGTGDNVVFNSVSGSLATALLNGQHTGTVEFRDLTGSTTFTAAANGNDIKIEGSQNLFIQAFDASHNLVGTTTQVFSVTGTGDLNAFVQAVDANGVVEPIQFFDLGQLKNGQNGFTFNAINGEVMTSLRIIDIGGAITDFEHYRLDVAPVPQVAAVPEPATWAMMLLGFVGIAAMGARRSWQGFRLT